MSIEMRNILSDPTLLFQHALEIVKTFPEAQQEKVLQILWQQLLARRQALADRIEPARQERARGEVQRGSVDDLLAEVFKAN